MIYVHRGMQLLLYCSIVVCYECHAETRPLQRYTAATNELAHAATQEEYFHALDRVAKESFVVDRFDEARKSANELLSLAPRFINANAYGLAIHDGNMVLGRLALKEGHIDESRHYLLEAGKSPGSPTLDTFGPNMSLARDLLENGQSDVVLQYLELCRKFWQNDYGKLNEWEMDIKAGKTPSFGA